MANGNCDEPFQELQRLEEENARLEARNADLERQLRVIGGGPAPVDPPGGSGRILLPGVDGKVRELSRQDLELGYKKLGATMRSSEVADMVDRGLEQRGRPTGADGRFANYDRILREVAAEDVVEYSRLTEALGILHERLAPDDFAMITQRYGDKRLAQTLNDFYRDLDVPDPEILARATVKSMPALNLVENKVWLRFWADRSKRLFIESGHKLVDFMHELPGASPPFELLDDLFRRYRMALALERHNNLVTRRVAQALRSQQQPLSVEQFRLDIGDSGEDEVAKALAMTPEDIVSEEVVAPIIKAVEDGRPEDIQGILDTIDIDGLDPKKTRLDKDWFNAGMRMANSLIKDSQLLNIGTQFLNIRGNVAMFFYSPVQQTLYNGFLMHKIGDALNRAPLLESMKISAEAHNLAWTTLRATWRRDVSQVFREGISNYSGNVDTYGARLLSNAQEIQDMQWILDQPFRRGRHWITDLGNPHNIGLLGNRLQAAARILALTKPNGIKGANAPLNRWQAAATALGFGNNGSRRLLRAQDIDMYLPWKTALRGMAAMDEVAGRYHFLFKLKADLEVKARMEGAQLGLFDDKSRAEWVQRRIDEAIYQATPSEANIISFRKEHGLKGSDFTDEQIAEFITERNLAGAPALDKPEAMEAYRYSAEMRFQELPQNLAQPEGTTMSVPQRIDQAAMTARQTWWIDRYLLGYWRSPFVGFLFDAKLASAGIADTLKVLGGADDPRLVARAKASWTIGGMLAASFFALDQAGLIGGSMDPREGRRNTFIGLPWGGTPILNTLFMWKDLKDVLAAAGRSDYDGEEVGLNMMKLLTGQVMRTWGVAQIHLLLESMMDPTGQTWERVSRFMGFLGSGQIPFTGVGRNIDRAMGMGRSNFFRDSPDTPEQRYLLDKDDPLAAIESWAKRLLADTAPGVYGVLTGKVKATDALGSDITGANMSRAFPFLPSAWPGGRINDVVYGEMATQDISIMPVPLIERRLEGIAMSDDLQQEYNGIFGTIKGDPKAPPSALLPLAGKNAQVTFNLPDEVIVQGDTSFAGVRIRQNETIALPLAQIVDKVTANKTRKEALFALFESPLYQAMEDDDATSAAPPRGLPKAMRRRRASQRLIHAITDYYDVLTQAELQRRATSGASPAAREWAAQRGALVRRAKEDALRSIRPLAEKLGVPLEPAQ